MERRDWNGIRSDRDKNRRPFRSPDGLTSHFFFRHFTAGVRNYFGHIALETPLENVNIIPDLYVMNVSTIWKFFSS